MLPNSSLNVLRDATTKGSSVATTEQILRLGTFECDWCSWIAFALAAIAGFVVSYAIGIRFAVGAIICFVAAHNLITTKVHFSAPFLGES